MLEHRFCTSRRLAISVALVVFGLALVAIGTVLEGSDDAGSLPLTLGIVVIGLTVSGLLLFYRRFKIERTNARQRMQFVNASQQSLVAEIEVLNYRSSGRVQRFVTPRESGTGHAGEREEEEEVEVEAGGSRGVTEREEDQKDGSQNMRGARVRSRPPSRRPSAD